MAEKKDNVKHVIILDEKKADGSRPDPDEAKKLERELNRYAPRDEYDEDDESETTVQRVYIKVRRGKKHKKLIKKIIILVLSLIILCIVAVAAVSGVTNNYMAQVRMYEEYLNKSSYSFEEAAEDFGNGLAKRRLQKLRKLLRSNEAYMDEFYGSIEESQALFESNRSKYGDDFVISLTVDSAVPLNNAQCNSYTADFNGLIDDIGSSYLSRTGDAKVNNALAELIAYLKDARITRGYRLYCTMRIRGRGPEGPVDETGPCELTAVKLKGRWILWDNIYHIFRLAY